MSSSKIILAGNPNVGKSTVFNALTGLKQHTGNWSGKTVDLACGSFKVSRQTFEVYDLPGTYSVISDSPEEKIARDYICSSDPNLIVVVADATCLARNLNLALQIIEMNSRVLLCVNLLDEAERNGIKIDLKRLQSKLGIPVIGICARRRQDIARLKTAISDSCRSGAECGRCAMTAKYPPKIETAAAIAAEGLSDLGLTPQKQRFIALKLLDNPSFGNELAETCTNGIDGAAERLQTQTEHAHEYLRQAGIEPINIRDMIVQSLVETASETAHDCSVRSNSDADSKTLKVDRCLTSKRFGIPLMLCFFGLILWITIRGANYPSQLLSAFFTAAEPYLCSFLKMLHTPEPLLRLITEGIYGTASWVTAVMLPPMAIFFPLFTLLEDCGALPRIAFNLDRSFRRANSCGKQALTMCMGLGCNAVGVTGCRIISSPRARLAAIITNTFIPCNGRFGLLTTVSAVFIGGIFGSAWSSAVSAGFVLLLIIFGVFVTLVVTKLLTCTIIKGDTPSFTLELPPYRRPQLVKTLTRSLLDRTLIILGRALSVAAPAGAVIWLMANIDIFGSSILAHCVTFLEPFAHIMGLDGAILLAFILALPANEIVLPIILMCYLSSSRPVDVTELSALSELLHANGWTILTAMNVMLFSILHFPCATTLRTIKAETGSLTWTLVSFAVPTAVGITVCILTTLGWNIISALI